MLKTKPIMDLFGRGEAAVARRIRRDRRRASEELGPLFDHIEERFYDADLTLDSMERQGVVDWHLRERFSEEMGLAIKPYLLRLKEELAKWLLWKTQFRVKHIAELLGYSRPFNFSRDFCRWTGQRPEDYRATRRGKDGAPEPRTERVAPMRDRICSRVGLELPGVGDRGQPAVAPGPLFVSLAGPHAEDIAQRLWEILREETPGRQAQLLRQQILFNGPELFQLLSRLSRDLGRRSRKRGVELAELALETVVGSNELLGESAGELHVIALARLGNARRLLGDMAGANEAFRSIQAISAGELAPGVEVEVLDLEASLRLSERRFDEALRLLDRSLELSRAVGDVLMQVNSLLQRSGLNRYQNRPQDTLGDLAEVQKILEAEARPDPLQLLGVHQERSLAYLELGNVDGARQALLEAKARTEALDHVPCRHQLQWIEGRLASREGEDASAERLLRLARAGFEEIGDHESAALAGLDLGILCHEQGRLGELTELLASAVIPVLRESRLADQAPTALKLLQEAMAVEAVPLAVLRKVRHMLARAHRDPARGAPFAAYERGGKKTPALQGC